MKYFLYCLTTVVVLGTVAVAAFIPQPPACVHIRIPKTISTTQTVERYLASHRVRTDEIAHEIIEMVDPKEMHKSKSHDRNTWKHVIEDLEHQHEALRTLQMTKHKQEHTKEEQIKFLQEKTLKLYLLTGELAARDLELISNLQEMEKERESIRKLTKRIFVLMGRRIKNGFLRCFGLYKPKSDKKKNDELMAKGLGI